MKKKLAILLTAVMTMAVAVPTFAHQVVVIDPSKEVVEETKTEETVEVKEEEKTEETVEVKEEEKTEETVEVKEEEKTEETVEVKEEEKTEETVEVKEEEKVEPIVTSPNKENDRVVVSEEGNKTTYSKVKEPKTIYNTAPSAEHPFTDLTGANADYGKAAYALGMTWGVTKNGVFNPDANLTVEDAVTFLYRLKGGEGKDGIIIAKISEANGYAQKPLTWAAGLGLCEGSVEPKAEITVGQLVSMIDKLGYTAEGVVSTDNTITRIDGLKLILDSVID